jgi:hypothetical protein
MYHVFCTWLYVSGSDWYRTYFHVQRLRYVVVLQLMPQKRLVAYW